MKKLALQLVLALGLVGFCVAKAKATLDAVRQDVADLRQDVFVLEIEAETTSILLLAHEGDLRRAGLRSPPELLSEAPPLAGPSQGRGTSR